MYGYNQHPWGLPMPYPPSADPLDYLPPGPPPPPRPSHYSPSGRAYPSERSRSYSGGSRGYPPESSRGYPPGGSRGYSGGPSRRDYYPPPPAPDPPIPRDFDRRRRSSRAYSYSPPPSPRRRSYSYSSPYSSRANSNYSTPRSSGRDFARPAPGPPRPVRRDYPREDYGGFYAPGPSTSGGGRRPDSRRTGSARGPVYPPSAQRTSHGHPAFAGFHASAGRPPPPRPSRMDRFVRNPWNRTRDFGRQSAQVARSIPMAGTMWLANRWVQRR